MPRSVLRRAAVGGDVSDLMPTSQPTQAVAQTVKVELAALFSGLDRYVHAFNEVAELYEAHVIDHLLLLGKRPPLMLRTAPFGQRSFCYDLSSTVC
jgi:hypothetical protein